MKNSIQKETRDEPRDEADPEKAALLNRRSLLAGTAGMVSAIVMRSVTRSAEAAMPARHRASYRRPPLWSTPAEHVALP